MKAKVPHPFFEKKQVNGECNTRCGKLTSFFELSGLKEKGS
jgi:hypothetical protein